MRLSAPKTNQIILSFWSLIWSLHKMRDSPLLLTFPNWYFYYIPFWRFRKDFTQNLGLSPNILIFNGNVNTFHEISINFFNQTGKFYSLIYFILLNNYYAYNFRKWHCLMRCWHITTIFIVNICLYNSLIEFHHNNILHMLIKMRINTRFSAFVSQHSSEIHTE